MSTGDSRSPAEVLDDLATGYRDTQILLAAVRLGVFAAVENHAPDGVAAGELAADLDADHRGVRILCDALVALGLLEKDGERYANGELARELLLPASPASKARSASARPRASSPGSRGRRRCSRSRA